MKFERKRAIKSNTKNILIRNVGFEKAKKFEELMMRAGKNEMESITAIIDLLDNELPVMDLGKTNIPQYVIDWRKANGIEHCELIPEELCRAILPSRQNLYSSKFTMS